MCVCAVWESWLGLCREVVLARSPRVGSSHGPTEPTKGEQTIWIEIRESRTDELTNPLPSLTGANFTAYQELKKFAHRMQPELTDLPSYQHMLIGLISGAMGPFSNAPIDTIKTRTLPFLSNSQTKTH